MGAGVVAVAGIVNEPSSCCAAIEEAQAELRVEVAGRNERRRELEFLEKGGDPLAFKSGETPSGLWSLSPTNPFAKQLLPSDGKGSCPLSNCTKEDDVEYSPEDGSEFKRARSITGKFCFVDRGATTISIESTPPDALPTSISSSIQHDRKDAPKKEFATCKSNKAAVKGQYARRNRQRTNRFGNGCVAFRDPGKVGSSNYSSGVRGSLTYDAEPKDVVKEQLTEVTADQDALQSRDTDVVACVREGQEKAGATNDHSDYDTAVQVCQPLLLETTHNTDASDLEEQDEDPQSMNQLPSSLPSSLQYNVEEGRNLPSSLPCNPEGGRNLPLSLPCDAEAKNSVTVELSRGLFAVSGTEESKQSSDESAKSNLDTVELSRGLFAVSGTEESKQSSDESAKSNLDPESMKKPCSGGIPEVNQVAEYEGIPNKANHVEKVSINDYISLPGHLSTFDMTRTRTASECRQSLDNKMNLMAVKSNNSTLELTPGSHVLEDKVQGIAASSLANKSSNNGLFGKAQRLEEVKVKVEDEMPADAVRSPSVARVSLSNERPVNPSMPQEPITLPPQYLEGGNMSSAHDVAEGLQVRVSGANGLPTADKLSGISLPREKMDPRTLGDGTSDIETNLSAAAKKADKNSTAQEAEGIKQDSLRQSADWAKRRDFQEPPRKKSHWDFVLEEMAWLANDFMQERLWKIAAAAQVARWVAKEKWQLEFEETELCNRQCKIARSLAKSVTKFWHSIEGFLLRDAVRADRTTMPSLLSTKTDPGADDEAHKAEAETVKPRVNKSKALPIQAYAIRFVENSLGWQPVAQAEAPPTPDRIAESGMSDFWEEQFPEESLFYTVPKHAMEVYRQSVVSQWEAEYEQRLQEHEAALAETEVHVAGETAEYSAGIYAVGPLVSPLVTGKRSSGFHGGSHTNVGSIPTKRMRTSAVAARQRAAGVTGPLVSGTAVHLTRSDISSCDTNSQQDEMTNFLEGSSVSGRATDVDSNGAFARNNMAADGVDSPFKSKKKKKTRHFNGGHSASAACDMRESEQLWQHNFHRQSEQREHSKHKGEQLSQIGIGSPGMEGLGATTASVTSSASKLVKQMTSRDRGRKYKAGKASLSQPGLGIPWSPVEDQAILRLVYELGLNWELVSDILSSNSQLKGIFRKPKDCKERYRLLTDRLGGDGGDSPDDPTSSTHLSISVTQKGGARSLPQHLEETLRIHVDCILHLHQQLRSRKLQIESQEPKQLVPEHESHASKHTGLPGAALTPLELCELSSTTGESVSHAYPLQPAHGNGLGIPSMMSPGIGMRPNSAMSVLHGANNLQLSPSMSPSAAINAAATRDSQRLGSSMRPLTAEEQRLRYSRMVAGRGLQTQGLSVTSGLPLMGLPSATDCAAPPKLPSGNSAGLMSGLSRGMPLTRTGLPGMGPIGVPNISAGMNNVLPSVGMGLSGAGAVNPGAVSPPVSMMRRPREAMSMGGHSQSAALNNPNSSLPNPVVSSPTQNLTAQQQQQLMQNNTLHAQQQSPGSSQQQTYNMMRVVKERQQLQQQHQKRMLQQQPGPTSNSSVSPFQSSQPLPVPQQQHVLSPHAHMYSQQHQPSHLLMQQHGLQQEAGSQQQHAVGSIPSSNVQQSAQSPSGQPSLSGNSQNSQQQQFLSQAHQPTSSASSTQTPLQTKQHQNISTKQQQQQQQGKNIKGMGRGASTQGQSSILPNQLSTQLSGQQMVQGQRMVQSQGTVPSGGQQLAGAPQIAVQNLTVNLSQVPDAVVQQYQQKGFPQHLSGKQIPQQQPTSISTCSIHPTSPPTGVSVPQQQLSPVTVAALPPTQQQRRASQQSQTQQRRPQQPQSGSSISTQLASHSGKNGLQPSPVPCQLPVGFQLGSNMNSPLSMASPSGGIPLLSPSTTGSGSVPSAQWKPGQSFSPMAAGLHNLSRSSGAAAQAPHLSMSMGMVMPLSNGNVPVTTNSLVTQEISRGGSQHASGQVGTLAQKPPVGSTATARAIPASQHMAPSQRQLAQQQQLSCMPNSAGGSQVRPASSGTTPAPE